MRSDLHFYSYSFFRSYYFSGETANVSDFINPDIFDDFKRKILEVKRIMKQSSSNKTIWLSTYELNLFNDMNCNFCVFLLAETSSAYKGGAPDMSDSYLASFIWMDKLGMAALNGIDAVMRQSFFKEHYALIDSNYDPLPVSRSSQVNVRTYLLKL